METILSRIKTLPALPVVVYQLTRLIDNPNSAAQDLARVISKDQSLTARVLRLVNSSYYAFRSRVSKVSHAISLMGFIAIKNIVLSLSLIDTFKKKEKDDGLDHESFWEHSLGTASAARSLGEKSGYHSPEEAFVAGLLHDIGKVIFDMAAHEDYKSAMAEAARKNRTIRAVEKEFFGYSHAELGAELAEKWNLPAQLRRAIRHHNDDEPKDALASLVFVANLLCKAKGVGFSGDSFVKHIPDRIWRSLDISRGSFTRIFSDLRKEVLTARVLLDMPETPPLTGKDIGDQRLSAGTPPTILIAAEKPRPTNILQLILETESYRVRTSTIPIRITPGEKREVDLIIIDTEQESPEYPDHIEVQIGHAATRKIPVRTIRSPFQPRQLLALTNPILIPTPR